MRQTHLQKIQNAAMYGDSEKVLDMPYKAKILPVLIDECLEDLSDERDVTDSVALNGKGKEEWGVFE